jgi:hypothetical protein
MGGVHAGFNIMTPGSRLEFTQNEETTNLRSNAKYSFGLLWNYPLNEKMMLEGGAVLSRQYFSPRGRTIGEYGSLIQYFGFSDARYDDIEFPLLLKINEPILQSNRKKIQIIVGGAWDIMYNGIEVKRDNSHRSISPSFNNLHFTFGLRLVNPWKPFGQLQYGVQYDYATIIQKNEFFTNVSDLEGDLVQPLNHFRLGLYYFWPTPRYKRLPERPVRFDPRRL